MTSSLRTRLGELVSTFATGIVDAVRGASLEEISGEGRSVAVPVPRKTREPAAAPRASAIPSAPSGRAAPARKAPARAERSPRRSLTDIAAVVDQIADLLAQHREGLRAEQIREALGVPTAELPRPLKEGLATRRFAKSGEKRATTYTLRAPKASPAKSAKGAKSAKSTKVAAPRPAKSIAPAAPLADVADVADSASDGNAEAPEGDTLGAAAPAPDSPVQGT